MATLGFLRATDLKDIRTRYQAIVGVFEDMTQDDRDGIEGYCETLQAFNNLHDANYSIGFATAKWGNRYTADFFNALARYCNDFKGEYVYLEDYEAVAVMYAFFGWCKAKLASEMI